MGIIFDDNDRFRWKIYYCTFLEQMLYNYFICANFHLFWQTFTANVCPIIVYIFKEPMPRDLLTLFWSSHPGPYIFFKTQMWVFCEDILKIDYENLRVNGSTIYVCNHSVECSIWIRGLNAVQLFENQIVENLVTWSL